MKTAIIYASKHGTTEKVVHKMKALLGADNCTLINLKNADAIDLNSYSQLIIGGSIHAGQIQRRVKSFLEKNTVAILEKRFALFLVYMNEPDRDKQIEKAFPEILRKKAISVRGVGGEFLFDKMNFFERLMVKKISGYSETVSLLKTEEIEGLINDLKLAK